MKRTRCSTWASPRTSRRSLATPRAAGRPRCSPRPCRRGSTAWCAATCATRCGSSSAVTRRRRPPRTCWCGRRPTSCRAGTSPPPSGACSTWRHRRPRSSSAVPGTRWTSSDRTEDWLVRQTAYIVPRGHKPAALGRVLDLEAPTATVVFCRTRDEVDQLTESLNGRGYRAEALHGGMDQGHRDRVMSRLRSQSIDLLVATDVAARGLDIEQLTHVVNYDGPSAPESYVHRIGRVGRAGREGTAITLVEPREHRMLKTIERATRQPITIEKLPTVADLRERRLELLRAALRESLLKDDDLDNFRAVVEPLGAEFDLFEVALAAVKLAHETSGTQHDEEELPAGELPAAGARDGRRSQR